MHNWTILKLIEWTTEYFAKNSIPNPRLDTELLLSHILNKKRIDLYLSFEQIVSEKDLAIFKGYIQRRIKREPLQYITGVQEFWGIPIKVTPAVLIPRPETELLVEKTLSSVVSRQSSVTKPMTDERRTTILDLCTGSGAIVAALASELPNAKFVGVDISEPAIEIAKQNTEKWKERIKLLKGDLFEPVAAELALPDQQSPGLPAVGGAGKLCRYKFDIITSNPPYVPEAELQTLQPEIRDFEPKQALAAGEDGLAIIKKIINTANKFLKPGGHLIMEIGDGQSEKVKTLIANAGFYGEIKTVKDYGGIERIIITNLK